MIDTGKADVFEWQVAQLLEGGLRCNAAGGHFGEEGLDLLGCHAT
jgi:hypothetical protein